MAEGIESGAAHPPLVARLLGTVALAVGDRPLLDQDWPRRSARTLLLLLLATPGHAVPRDRVLDTLWPEATPDAARNALYVALHTLRRVLEPDLTGGRTSAYIDATADAIRCRSEPGCQVDVDQFERHLTRARAAPDPERRRVLQDAVTCYRGDLLTDEPYADWPVARREGLRQGWERAVLDLARLDLVAGEPLASQDALAALVAADPTLEEGHRALIAAYGAAGQMERARRQYERCVKVLREELDVAPSAATEALVASLQDVVPESAPVAVRRRFSPPPMPPTPLIGRDAELSRAGDLLWNKRVRLVTLTGLGGIGKTHLALTIAAAVGDDFADGVAFVSLAALRDPTLVLPTIARTFGVRDEGQLPLAERLTDAIHALSCLCLIDNFEPVIEAAPVVADLLAAAPALKVLVTSRERLRLRGEHEVEVPPLPTLDPVHLPSSSAVARNEAVTLFTERVQAIRPSFAVSETNAALVAGICHRLDGIPLAIELAAAWGRDLEPAGLLKRLDRRLDLLERGPRDLPARLQTMREAIAWSYGLLGAEEQALFRRLSVFVGGARLDLLAEVVGGLPTPDSRLPTPDSVLDGVTALAAKSLVRLDGEDDARRVMMLETVREYGLEALERSGEATAVRRAHATAVLALVTRPSEDPHRIQTANQPLDVFELELDNIRAAVDASFALGEDEVALGIAVALRPFWRVRGHRAEGWQWLERGLAATMGQATEGRADGLAAAGALALDRGDLPEAARLLTNALTLYERLDRPIGVASTIYELMTLAHFQGDFARQEALCERVLAIASEIGHRRLVSSVLNGLANAANGRGDFERARALWTEMLDQIEETDDIEFRMIALSNLTGALANLGHAEVTIARGEECLALARRHAAHQVVPWALVSLATGHWLRGDLLRARSLIDEALETAAEMDDPHSLVNALSMAAEIAWAAGEPARTINFVREELELTRRVGLTMYSPEAVELLAGRVLRATDPVTAVRLMAAADARRTDLDVGRTVSQESEFRRAVAAARADLGDDAFDAAWADGRPLPMDQLIVETLDFAGRVG